MKNKIIELLKEINNISLTALKKRLEGSKGEFNFFFPLKNIDCSNILLASEVSEEFINSINELIKDGKIIFKPTDPLVVSHDGGEIYTLPIARRNRPKAYTKIHWLPLMIMKGPNI